MQYVYILASRPRGALYTGLTNDIVLRVEQHRSGKGSRHTARYGIKTLVWFAEFEDVTEAAAMERRLKRWRRDWKFDLIEKANPDWRDLAPFS